MHQSVFTFQAHGSVGVACITLTQVAHPEELDRLRHEFRQYVASTDFAAYVLDLSALEYMTSAAIGVLLNVHAHLSADGRGFAVVAAGETVLEALEHSHLEKMFPVCRRLADALASVS